jgi:O-antigen/teichoic acid export membrane protein
MMADNLRQKTVDALSWSFLQTVAQRGLQFAIGIILARLLFPEQFGLIGMLAIFIAVIQAFLDSGFGAALIQKRDVTKTDTCSVFYFNIVVGLVGAGVLSLGAPWIAAFYNQPILTPLTRALSLTLVINSFGMIQKTLLTRQIDFKTQTKVGLIAGALSGIAGITLAVLNFGVWSLVVQQISAAFVSTVCLWVFSPWRPTLIFSFTALGEMFGFGSRLLFSSVLNQVFDNIYLVVIGKLFSPTDLGFFTRAKTLNDLPSQTLSGMVARVTFPVFSTIQDDPARLKRGMKKALTTLGLVNFPMMIGLAIVAHPLVLILLTDKWAPCVPYLQLLCVGGLLYPLHLINLNVLQALGRSDLYLRLEIIKKVLIVVNIAVTWRWGISAMIGGMVVMSIISYYFNSYYAGILISYSLKEQLRDLAPYLIMAGLMGSTVYAAGLLPFMNHWSMLLTQVIIAVAVYLSLCWLFRLTSFMEIKQAWWHKMGSAELRTE